MSKRDLIRYFGLWQVDPTTQGKEQERFFKLRRLLGEAAAYLCLPHRDDPFLPERMPFEKALEILARAWGMKAAALGDMDLIKTGSLLMPMLAREGQELVLLLPYDDRRFARYGGSRTKPQLIEKKQLGRYFKELFLLYAAGQTIEALNARTLNKRLQSLLPSMLIFFACLLKLSLLGLALVAASFLLSDSSEKNLIALLQALSISLVAAFFLDFFISKNALKNAALVKLWLLSLLFHRTFSLSLREYIHRSMDDILILRRTLLKHLDLYFAKAPIYFHAWALLVLNGILFLFLKPFFALLLLVLTLAACGVKFVLGQHLKAKRAALELNLKHLGYTLASLQASFSMAHSLGCLSPILERLKQDGRESREHAQSLLTQKLLLQQSRAFVPLGLGIVAAHALSFDNKALALVLMIDAFFIGLALVALLWPGRTYNPLPKYWISAVNQLHGVFGHKVEAVGIKGRIELVNISFSYEESPTLIFQGLSLTIMEGQSYGIVGPSGSGKSTLLRLLMGQVEADRGQVIFDGQDLRSLKLRTLRQHFGVIGPSTSLFAGSIIDNILCGRSFKPRDLSYLFYSHEIYDLLLDLPMGLQTYVFKDAQNLSRIQVVLIMFARALIHQPKILFMDEILKGMPASEQVLLKDYVRSLTMTRIIASHHDLDDLSCSEIFRMPHTLGFKDI